MNPPLSHVVIEQWTPRHAFALQNALRLSQDDMAELLGVAKRTIAAWHASPDLRIRNEIQRALDTAYERAPEPAKLRFVRQIKADDATEIDEIDAAETTGDAVKLTVSIAVVLNESQVLVVQRREVDDSGIVWQFPAGIVKPGAKARTIATRETLAETGIHCAVRADLGSRVHPRSGVFCQYFLCDYLAGQVENRDTAENLAAIWIPGRNLTRFIPEETVFPPVLRILEEKT